MAAPTGDHKRWAREAMRGVQTLLFPSFTADLAALDEAGIRHDVEQAVRNGFFSVHCATEAGLTYDETREFIRMAARAAGGRVLVSATVIFDTHERNLAFLAEARALGLDLVLIGHPPAYYPKSPEEVARLTQAMAQATDVGVVLYPNFKYNFARFAPGGFPLDVLARSVRLPNVVGVLCALTEPGYLNECFSACSEHALVQCPWERWWPLAVQRFGQQWAGPGAYELFQSPESPRLTTYFRHLLAGEHAQAMPLYWRLTPARLTFEKQFMPTQMLGTYHWPQQKYYQWLTGGNGGYTRQPVMRLAQHDMDEARNAVRALGLAAAENDEEFFVGRAEYARGHRPY